jgi:hypothetical protein
MVLTTVRDVQLTGTAPPYAASVNYGASRVRMAQMQAGLRAAGPFVAGLAGLNAPVAAGLANFGSSKFVGGGVDVDQSLPVERFGGTRDLGSAAKAGYSGMNAQYPGATIAGLAAQIGSPVAWRALVPAMEKPLPTP